MYNRKERIWKIRARPIPMWNVTWTWKTPPAKTAYCMKIFHMTLKTCPIKIHKFYLKLVPHCIDVFIEVQGQIIHFYAVFYFHNRQQPSICSKRTSRQTTQTFRKRDPSWNTPLHSRFSVPVLSWCMKWR